MRGLSDPSRTAPDIVLGTVTIKASMQHMILASAALLTYKLHEPRHMHFWISSILGLNTVLWQPHKSLRHDHMLQVLVATIHGLMYVIEWGSKGADVLYTQLCTWEVRHNGGASCLPGHATRLPCSNQAMAPLA